MVRKALRAAKGATEPIHPIVQSDNFVSSYEIDYHDGERCPLLECVDGSPDWLDEITRPLAVPWKVAARKPADSEQHPLC